ncbi:MAG TPA: aminotransferase class III-fold pyridoxal phosphate-dependent enzyme [Bdellovibrionota bacterium]|nr:aminotransferase class III-fold pyridoxal phosphate-dependent enzyme [Bdellovibrionota bacterium]
MISDQFKVMAQKVLGAAQGCSAIKGPNPELVAQQQAELDKIAALRGRPLLFPMWPTGKGSGPYIEFEDGSVKLDMISGIGVSLFGHGHPELLMTLATHGLKAPHMQGTLMPGDEYQWLARVLLDGANRPVEAGKPAQMAGVWLTTCGTMANELALKILRQKKAPAWKVISFKNAFAGRSAAMQELTDEPKYREGQPNFGQFEHIPYFDATKSVEQNIEETIAAIDKLLAKDPEAYAGMGFEIVQGEGGGFASAPRNWWIAVLDHAKSKGLGIWFDEVQTIGRTGELFAYQRFGLGEYADVVSCAKPIQAGAVLWSKDYAPKAGLIGGTFAGSSGTLAVGAKIVELLCEGSYFGSEGSVQRFENFVKLDLASRREKWAKFGLGEANVTGGMIAFGMLDGGAESIKNLSLKYFANGVLSFWAGKSPVRMRFLPPMGIMTEEYWLEAMDVLDKTLGE